MKIRSCCRALLYTCAVLLCGLLRGAVGWGLPFCFVFLCFVSCSSSLLAGLVTSCGCGCLLSGVDDVFPCFCALCSDLCEVAWVSVLVFCLFGGCALASLFLYLNVLPSLGGCFITVSNIRLFCTVSLSFILKT